MNHPARPHASALPLIVDCDPGIDDALALLLAASAPERLQLVGVSCVSGNRPLEITTDNASRVLALAGRSDVPVFRGAAAPLSGGTPVWNLVHGADGLGGVALPAGAAPAEAHAVDYLCQTLSSWPDGELTLAAIGPLTNLAQAELRAPGLLARLRRLLIMGGAVRCAGNVTPTAEFNFFADPAAARVVLNANAPIMLFGLDATSKAIMPSAWVDGLGAAGGRCAQAAERMLKAYAQHDPLLHDACPIAYLLAPELFAGSPWHLQVNTEPGPQAGQVVAMPAPVPMHSNGASMQGGEPPPTGAIPVAFEVDVQGLLALVRAGLARLP